MISWLVHSNFPLKVKQLALKLYSGTLSGMPHVPVVLGAKRGSEVE